MKSILLSGLLICSFFNAQSVHFENFESFNLGNLSASTNAFGQNNNFVGYGNVIDYQITNIDSWQGKSLEIATNGNTSAHFVSKEINAAIPHSGNTLLVADYSFYTGNIAGTGGISFTLSNLDSNYIYRPVVSLYFSAVSGKFEGRVALMQGNNRVIKTIQFGNNSYPQNVWLNVSLSYDLISGECFWTTPEGNFSLTNAPAGYALLPNLNISQYEMRITSDNTNLKAGFDNINIYYSDSVLATKEFTNSNIKNNLIVFPNPASDYLYLKSNQKITEMKIFDVSGKTLLSLSQSDQKIDISELIKGTYFLTVKNSDGSSSTQKFIKK
ncbi:T9SS type A sorting domain-containing protein [Chryseobacterium sp. MMS23-Vi53]|uniref:T9SS type A sorting domain-containing protein n=1 Tax=Chryseobacterium sp. MMS23-Vi53 TaxID=3386644 RepID=UPI0039E8240F